MYQEDVFHLYERNKSMYTKCTESCSSGRNRSCADLAECVYQLSPNTRDVVLPITIGERYPCRLNVKTYIKIGDECSVCLEPMFHKTDAYLTGCGHSFHRKCLSRVFKAKWETKPFSVFRCPLCRSGLGCPDLFVRYDGENQLDKLENFWITKDCLIPELCDRGKHYLGMKSSCQTCLNYRDTGYVTY
jgi:hypothetical protein